MPRSATAALLAEFVKGNLLPVVFCETEWASGFLRLWSGIGTITWNGLSWVGAGKLGAISPVPETTAVRADNFTIALSGIPSDVLAKALTDCRTGKMCKVWFGGIAADGSVIADPALCASGYMDVPTIEPGVETTTISITVENRMARLQQGSAMRYTDECQRSKFPTDGFFRFVTQIQDISVVWGRATQVPRAGVSAGRKIPSPE